ncbi:amino acid adenylation domain-containing protein [Nocardia sp. NPDC051321]|uniref:amino acid adenylation domain-containing protein n=1 Tax=Nocardia sp. NPDC051321 TaxID=3364323 RepID=UPI003794F3DD
MGESDFRYQVLTFDHVRHEIAELVDIPAEDIEATDDLVRLGLDSIGLMRLAGQWRRQGIDVAFNELIEFRTLTEWWDLLSQRVGAAAPDPVEYDRVDEWAPFALAPMQYAYWIGRADGQVLGGVGAHFYNEFDRARVDPARLAAAVRALLDRHGMLRATIDETGKQRVLPHSSWPGLTVHDLRGAAEEEEAARQLLLVRDRWSHRRLAVERGEVFDVALSLLPDGTSRMHLQIEMLVADAQSFRLLITELARLYDRPDEALPPLEFSYPRYLAAVRVVRAAKRKRDAEYWARLVPELPDPPRLPLDRAPEEITRPRVQRRFHWMEAGQWRRLADNARRHQLSLASVLLTTFAEVLGQWSEQSRFLLNLPLYDREPLDAAVPGLVGDFTNLLLLDVDTGTDLGFAAAAARLQRRMHEYAAHAAYSGLDVLRDLTRERGVPARAPVVFTSALGFGELFDTTVRQAFGAPGWTMSQTPQVWLDFQVTEREGRLFLNWDAVEGLFAAGVLDAMFDACLRVLDRLAEGESHWRQSVPELLPGDQQAVRIAVNDTDVELGGRSLHGRFFDHAARRPDDTALVSGRDDRLSYAGLAERALGLAAVLVDAGVLRGDRVIVHLPQGPEQRVAVLAVLACGGVYVPIGADQPPARRDRICAIAGARVAVVGAGMVVPGVVSVPAQGALALPLPGPVPVAPNEPAYLLFTSGTTGQPKGVVVSHGAATNTIDGIVSLFGAGPDDRVLALSAADFDLSVFDTFAMLSNGGAVVCVSEEQRRDPVAWLDLVRRHRVTIWQTAPMLLDALLREAAERDVALDIRLALLGGDWVRLDLRERLRSRAPRARMVALGGTTETAIHSTVFEVDRISPQWKSVPYGRPLPNQRCRVTDAHGRNRPDQVPGELWIGGASVAVGYYGDEQRTADKFRWHAGERWYRTGDLARYLPDGTLEFLGRIDTQLKIRGHRIEPGEVEAALCAHPAVATAVVTTCQGVDGSVLLGAVAAVRERPVSAADLHGHLRALLPPAMLPARLVVTGALPLTRNGKVDRAAVRALLSTENPASQRPDRIPVGPLAQKVARIWAELLDVATVEPEQSFFALGGDSLIATRMLRRLRAAGVHGGDLPTLMTHPVLAEFADSLHAAPVDTEAPIRPDEPGRYEPFPLTEVQQAYWLGRDAELSLGGVGSHWYWEFDGVGVDLARLTVALNRLIERHEMLRAVVDTDGCQRVLSEVGHFAIAVRRARDDGVAELRELRSELGCRIPDLASWPLLEVRAVEYGRGRVRLGFSFDYIVLDALSIVRFFVELDQLYRHPESHLPPIGVSFRDYVLSAVPSEAEHAVAQRYWSEVAKRLPPAPQLPLRVDPATVRGARFSRRETRVPRQQWDSITRKAREHGLTPATVLATAYAEVLAAWCGRDELTLTLTLFNRRPVHPDIELVFGDFTSLLLIGHRAQPGESLADTARRFQETTWAGMNHSAVSAIEVLRELARNEQLPVSSMPVVFTSALGISDELVELSFPFGELIWGVSQTPQVWLDNQVMIRGGELVVNWDAADELFCDGVLDAMFAAYLRLLSQLAETDWAKPLPDLLPAQQHAVRAAVNATEAPIRERTLHADFFALAQREPSRPALLGEQFEVSRGELAERALRIAGLLDAHGVLVGEVVGICLDRGVDQVAAVFGVLAAGCAYVPVGTDQPAERSCRIFGGAGVRTVLTDSADREFGDAVRALPVATAGAPRSRPLVVAPDATAYVIYTSGSTGEPKGVEITHRAACNTIDAINERFGVSAADRVLAVSALDFDLSVYDLFGLLSVGGAVVLPAERDRREARVWHRLAVDRQVTIWNSVPALLDMLLITAGVPDELRLVLVSGDWVLPDLAERVHAQSPDCRFVALGGATEAAIWSNAFEVGAGAPCSHAVPYGFPLTNQRYRVVDGRGRDCPDWVAGELWIGGAGVALGYHRAPELTADRFVTVAGERWYRTGDTGRYRPDGTLEFLGRTDFQVKLRGHRIELGEIEAALLAEPGVAAAVALVAGAGAGRSLAAAVVPRPGPAPDPARLVAALRHTLPHYMVPARIECLPALPLTSNGKVDRRALGRQLNGSGADDGASAPPADGIERSIGGLWVELLGLARIGRGQNFFALGGNSLLATRLVAEIRRRWGTEVSLREVFDAPTVAELAALVEAALADGRDEDEEGTL